jgi:hypothetical protein
MADREGNPRYAWPSGSPGAETMTFLRSRAITLILVIAACAVSTTADAQWVTVARKAIGRVEQMTQSLGNDGPSYDVAAVMLEAPIDGVWAGVLRALKANAAGITVTTEDSAQHLVQFTDGRQIAGIKLSVVGDRVTHLLVSSARQGGQAPASALVMDSVLRTCREVGVSCAPARP